jgi:hypothetical protein
MEKIFNKKNINNFVWSPLVTRGNIYIFLPSSSLSDVYSLILFPLFATGVVETGGNLPPAANLPPVSLTPVANLPPVSTTQGELVAKFAAGVVDLRISPRIFEKFEMILTLLSGAWGKVIHEKNLKQKIS